MLVTIDIIETLKVSKTSGKNKGRILDRVHGVRRLHALMMKAKNYGNCLIITFQVDN